MKLHEVFGIVLLFVAGLFMDGLAHEPQKLVANWFEIMILLVMIFGGIFLLLKGVE